MIPTLLADDYFVNPSYDIPLYYSGGNFQASANRHGFVTELIFEDNPGLDESAIAALDGRFQGIDTLHVLPQLPPSVDGTGHLDMWLYLVDEDTVIISEFLPGSNQEAIDITNNAVPYMQALGYEVIRTPAFNAQHLFGPTHYTYTNAFRWNDRIFLDDLRPGQPGLRGVRQPGDRRLAAGRGTRCRDRADQRLHHHLGLGGVPLHRDAGSAARGHAALRLRDVAGRWRVPGSEYAARDHLDRGRQCLDQHGRPVLLGGWRAHLSAGPGHRDRPGGRREPRLDRAAGRMLQARVRVLVRDNAGNAVEAASEGDVLIESAFRRVYDFSTGAGVDRFAWGDKTTSWAQIDGVRRPVNNQLSAANYTKLSASDATTGVSDPNRYVSTMTAPADFEAEATHVFEFTIAEDPALIRHRPALGGLRRRLQRWSSTSGVTSPGSGATAAASAAGRLRRQLRRQPRRGPGRRHPRRFPAVHQRERAATLLLYAERSFDRSYHDYVSATVTYDECLGADPDFDGWGTACDNCAETANVSQANADGDVRGDACDCAAGDGTVFAVPHEIGNVRLLADRTSMAWDSDAGNSGPGTVYQVLQGAAGQFPVGTGAGESCLAAGIADTALPGLPAPPPASGYYLLVRGKNACGTGTYGSSAGVERVSPVCP